MELSNIARHKYFPALVRFRWADGVSLILNLRVPYLARGIYEDHFIQFGVSKSFFFSSKILVPFGSLDRKRQSSVVVIVLQKIQI